MADAVTEIQAKFTADIAQLQTALNTVSSQVQSVMVQGNQKAAVATKQSNAIMAKSYSAIGSALQSITPFMDANIAKVVMFGNVGKEAIKNLSEWLNTLGMSMKAALPLAIAAAAVAIVAYTRKTREAATATKAWVEQQKKVTDIVSKGSNALENWREMLAEASIRRGEGLPLVEWQDALATTEAAIVDVSKARAKLLEVDGGAGKVFQFDKDLETLRAFRSEILKEYGDGKGASPTAKVAQELDKSKVAWNEWVDSLEMSSGKVLEAIAGNITEVTRGVGDTLAQCIVYGEDWGAAFADLGKRMLANLISTLAQMLMQEVLFAILGQTVFATQAAGRIALQTAVASASGVASVWETMPWFVALGLAPGIGAAAAGQAAAAASAGAAVGQAAGMGIGSFGFAAKGTLVTGPGIGVIGEAGPEIVAPRSQFEALMQPRGGGQSTVVFEVDGREMARGIVPWIPGALRLKGIRV